MVMALADSRRKARFAGTCFVAVALLAPVNSLAQTTVFAGGAATFPVGGLTSSGGFASANVGWQATLGAQFAVGESRLTIGPRLYFGSNEHETSGDKSNLFGVTALLNYGFRGLASLNPFVWGEVGVLSHSVKSDSSPSTDETLTTGLAAGGAGIGFPLGDVRGFVAGGYNSHLGGDIDTTYFGLYAGVSFPLGGG